KTDETPSENAQRFFTRYRKLVNSAKVVKKEIHKTIHEINYLRNLLQQIDTAHESDIEEIRDELKEEGYLKKQKQRKRKKNQKQINKIKYLRNLHQQIDTAHESDIEEIRDELKEEGYLKKQKQRKRKKNQKPKPDEYKSSDGTVILVGRNNNQNGYVTHKVAHRDDTWLHTLNIPGSHVVIRSNNPSEETLIEA